jgi:hypothetical protein
VLPAHAWDPWDAWDAWDAWDGGRESKCLPSSADPEQTSGACTVDCPPARPPAAGMLHYKIVRVRLLTASRDIVSQRIPPKPPPSTRSPPRAAPPPELLAIGLHHGEA